MGKVILIRHAETAFNKSTTGSAERLRGWLDIPLDEHGKAQTKEIAKKFEGRDIARIYSSPLSRAKETAQAIEGVTGAPLSTDRALMPWNLGDWAGKPVPQVLPKMKAYVVDDTKRPPNGESFAHFRKRYLHALIDFLRFAEDEDKTIVVVTHSRNLQTYKAWKAAGCPADCSVDTRAMNDYSHESPVGSELVIDPKDCIPTENSMDHGKPKLSVLLAVGKKPPMGDHADGADDGGSYESEDEYDNLSDDEIKEHQKNAAESLIEGVKSGDDGKVVAAFNTLHALHHACWDKEGEAPESSPDMDAGEEGGDEEGEDHGDETGSY